VHVPSFDPSHLNYAHPDCSVAVGLLNRYLKM
jgi:hypothetical protein